MKQKYISEDQIPAMNDSQTHLFLLCTNVVV